MRSILNVAAVIDFDGFQLGKKFYIKEIGYFNLRDNYPYNFFVKLPMDKYFSERDYTTIRYATNRIHGMAYENRHHDVPYYEVSNILHSLYRDAIRVNRSAIFAYKGGTCEMNFLRRHGIPCINLENYGLNWKYEELCGKMSISTDNFRCHRHNSGRNSRIHCAKKEAYAFGIWTIECQKSLKYGNDYGIFCVYIRRLMKPACITEMKLRIATHLRKILKNPENTSRCDTCRKWILTCKQKNGGPARCCYHEPCVDPDRPNEARNVIECGDYFIIRELFLSYVPNPFIIFKKWAKQSRTFPEFIQVLYYLSEKWDNKIWQTKMYYRALE